MGDVAIINGLVFPLVIRTVEAEFQGWLRPAGYVETKYLVISHTNFQEKD